MHHILFVQTAFLGDLLLGIPTLKNLRRLYPEAELHLVCRKGLGSFFVDANLVDQAYEIEKNKKDTYRRIQVALKSIHFDIIISPHESFRTALFVRSLAATKKVSYKRWFQYMAYGDLLPRPMQYPEALRQAYLLTAISEDMANKFKTIQDKEWRFMDSDTIPDWASMQLAPHRGKESKTVCLAPGSVWATKMWPKEHYAEVAKVMQQKGYQTILVGSKGEAAVCEWISEHVKGVVNKCGKTTLQELLQVFANASLLVSNDSGPMHMAAAAGLPNVAIFGPTVLSFGYRPWQGKAKVVEENLNCRPCGKHGHRLCPIGTHACMKNLEVSKVIHAIEKVIE